MPHGKHQVAPLHPFGTDGIAEEAAVLSACVDLRRTYRSCIQGHWNIICLESTHVTACIANADDCLLGHRARYNLPQND